jgi:hypothetical protein
VWDIEMPVGQPAGGSPDHSIARSAQRASDRVHSLRQWEKSICAVVVINSLLYLHNHRCNSAGHDCVDATTSESPGIGSFAIAHIDEGAMMSC